MTKVSIIIPVFNASEFLEKTLESVFKQSLNDIEIVCVDDGSTDNSLEILNEMKTSHPNINIIQQENHGVAIARNVGIENANGEYIAFLDSDDIYVDSNALEDMYNFGKENDANVVAANLTFMDPDYTLRDNPHYSMGDYDRFDDFGEIESGYYGIPYAFYKNIYKKEFLVSNNIVFPDIVPGEDPIFLANVLVSTPNIFVVPFTLYGYNNSIGGGVNAKITTYEKKKTYVQHFKDVADILRDGGHQKVSDFYKIHLFRYLNWDKNNSDSELFEIYDDVFGMDYEAFDKTDFNYTKFNIATKFYFAIKNDSEEFYRKVNKEFLTINIYDTIALSEDILDKYLLTVYSYSVDDLKSNYNLYLMNNVEFMKEFSYFKIEKMIFNLDIQKTETVFRNAKMVISGIPIWEIEKLSKRTIKKCYRVLSYDSVRDY